MATPNSSDDRRADIAGLMDKMYEEVESTEPKTSAEAEPATEEPAPEPAEPAAGEVPVIEPAAPEARDQQGRFVAGAKPPTIRKPAGTATPVAAGAPAAGKAPAVAPPTAPAAAPQPKPPASWTPAAREEWSKVPPKVQAEVLRLEGETRKVLQQSAALRREHESVAATATQYRTQIDEALRPVAGVFHSMGVNPMDGAADVLRTYGALHGGDRVQKAAIVADLLARFTSIDDVNAMLSGQVQMPQQASQRTQAPSAPPHQAPDVAALVRQQLEQLQEAAVARKADQEVAEFLREPPEFLEDVRPRMEAILAAADSHPETANMTLAEAYEIACSTNKEIQAILRQRNEAARVTAPPSANTAQRARVAAATLRTNPAGAGEDIRNLSRRDQLEALARKQGINFGPE